MSVESSFETLRDELDVDAELVEEEDGRYKIVHEYYDVGVHFTETGMLAADRAQVSAALRKIQEFQE